MFSHDGVRDSLTALAAPPRLYEELRRELARAKRAGAQILLVRFVLAPYSRIDGESAETIERDRAVLEFARSLQLSTRAEDLVARMGEFDFLVTLQNGELSMREFVLRCASKWPSEKFEMRLGSASVLSHPDEGVLDLLNRLDLEPLEF